MKEDKRVVKFRAWDRENSRMIYDVTSGIDLGMWLPFSDVLNDNRFEVMQYTGIIDSNGRKVYEGDVVSELGAFILWDDELACWCFNFKTVDTPNVPLFYRDTISKMEVLGNIYEHPELLTPPTSKP